MGRVLRFPLHARASADSLSGTETIPHNDAGAVHSAASSAPCNTTKVSAGNFPNDFQLKAAPYLRPVSDATLPTPPSASKTSTAVVKSRNFVPMTPMNNPNFLDTQHPNLIGSKKFGGDPLSPPMANAGTDGDEDVALRCRVLTRLYAQDNSSQFAADIGISSTRWNGIENSGALSRDVARLITRQYPEVSLDWLYRGKDDGLTKPKSDELFAAFRELAVAHQRPAKVPRKKRRAS